MKIHLIFFFIIVMSAFSCTNDSDNKVLLKHIAYLDEQTEWCYMQIGRGYTSSHVKYEVDLDTLLSFHTAMKKILPHSYRLKSLKTELAEKHDKLNLAIKAGKRAELNPATISKLEDAKRHIISNQLSELEIVLMLKEVEHSASLELMKRNDDYMYDYCFKRKN